MDTRSSILEAALAAFTEQGYEATTVQAIRERAGVSNGSLFHFFRSKEAIGATLYLEGLLSYQSGLLDIVETHGEDALGGIAAFVRHHLAFVENELALARFLFERGRPDWGPAHKEAMHEANTRTYHAVGEWLRARMEAGQLRQQPVQVVLALLEGSLHVFARPWLTGRSQALPSQHAEALIDSLWAALRP